MTTRFTKTRLYTMLFAALLCGLLAAPLAAEELTKPRLTMTLHVNEVGNAKVDQEVAMPLQSYAMLKQNLGDPLLVMHSMEAAFSWLQIENLRASFNDQTHAVEASFDCTGLSRTLDERYWSIDLAEADGFELLDIDGNRVTFALLSGASSSSVSCYVRVHLPQHVQDVAYNTSSGLLTYKLAPNYEAGNLQRSHLTLQAEEHLLGSLAMLYAKKGSDLFAARSLFYNSGNQPIYNLRVRFRVANFSVWSSWSKSPVVHPGQTVVDPFYPVLDIDKIAALNGTRYAMIEVEYAYEDADGELVQDTDAQRTQLLSRNEVVYSRRSNAENLTWFDRFDLAPFILASFTNGTDSVMQQFVGRVNARAGGLAASASNDHAIKYLETMWNLLQENGVAYQTPPSYSINNHFGQHIKFGRDVLRNRAGTCIDLAILWASAAESVGLKPHIALIPGHAFPVIELPNGTLLPIESTMLTASFSDAVKRGFEELEESKQKGLFILTDIESMRSQGARSIDLPTLREDVLAVWGYSFDGVAKQQTERVAEQRTERREVPALVGIWEVDAVVDGYRMQGRQMFKEDGTYLCVLVFSDGNGYSERIEEQGTYVDHGDYFEFDTNIDHYTQRYRLRGNELKMEFEDLEAWVVCKRVNE